MEINEYLKYYNVNNWNELNEDQRERWIDYKLNEDQRERWIDYNNKIAYRNGIIDGIRRYSWMKNGVAYVGTTGRTLKKAIEEVKNEYGCLEP